MPLAFVKVFVRSGHAGVSAPAYAERMLNPLTRVLAALVLMPAALAQTTPVPATPTSPTPTSASPVPALTPRITLENARLTAAARAATGGVQVTLNVQNAGGSALALSANRDSLQGCAVAPHVRVLKVGSREVVYPNPADVRLCAQDIVTREVAANGATTFTRDLQLPAGEYLIEVWFQGFVGGRGDRVRVAADAVRVTVR